MKSPARPTLKTCEVILNYECNAKCLFCYHPTQLRGPELPLRETARALLAGRRRGCWIAYFIGGEITLRPDLPRITALARGLGYPCVQVMTNGLLLADPEYARRLVGAGANLFRISIHSHDAARHDRLVGVPGAFGRVMRAMENLRCLGADVAVNHTINALNYRDAERFAELLCSRFALTDINFIFSHFRGEMSVNLDLLKVRISRTAPYVRRAMEVLRRRRVAVEAPMLVNYTPCVLPGMDHLLAEWERLEKPEDDDMLVHPEGFTTRIYDMKEAERVKPASCSRCVYHARCLGFEREYRALYGTAEYRPLAEFPKPFPLYPTYARMERMGVPRG
ncbi:MAG: radical SAM protein [Elusimicrobia bacterium]|nr:radical SAM protein [Elusimicrobiota bacterium]